MSEEEDRFPARRILDEDPKKRRYKVDWEGVDPETGRAWSPTWEPYEFVSDVLVNEYKSKQRRRSAPGLQKASRAALRDFDIKRNKSHTPSEEEYVSPAEEEQEDADNWLARQPSKAEEARKPKPKRKSEPSGSGSSYKPSNQSTRSTEQSTELSTIISSGSLKALQSQAANLRRNSEPTTSTKKLSEKAQGKRRRQEDPIASPERSRPASKKSRKQAERDEVDFSPDEESEEEDVPVVYSRRKLSSGAVRLPSRESNSPHRPLERLSAIPEALRLKTASTSVSRITHGPADSMGEGLFASRIILDAGDPPSARRKSEFSDEDMGISTNAARRAQAARAGKAKKSTQPLFRRQSEERNTRSVAEASLPSFKKKTNGATAAVDASYNQQHERRPSASANASKSAWPLLDTASKEASSYDMEGDSPSIIPDSAPHSGHALSPVQSPPLSGTRPTVEGSSNRDSWRTAQPPGSRLAYANIEKTRVPVKVPEPEVFKSFLASTQMTEDIQQFSSQASPPEASSSEEILRALTATSKSVEDGTVPPSEKGHAASASTSAYRLDDFETAPDADFGMPTLESVPEDQTKGALASDTIVGVQKTIVSEPVNEVGSVPPVDPISSELPATASAISEAEQSAEAGQGSASLLDGTEGARVLGPAEVVETIESEREARAKVRQSTLFTNESMRQDLLIYVDSPAYYIHTKRSLTKQALWDFELELTADENEQIAWHLLLDMEKGEYKLEKRVRKFVTIKGDSNNDQVMSLYNDLRETHATLKKTNDAATLRIGELESDIVFMREQDRAKAKQIDELAGDKQRLEAEIQLLRQQVTLGVKQVELIWSAKEQRAREELDKTRKQLEMTKTLIRTSNIEELRSRAAQVEELEARERNRLAAEQAEKQRQAMRRSNIYSQFIDATFSRIAQNQPADSADGVPGQAAIPAPDEADSEDDEDFVAGASSEGSDNGSSSSYDSSDEVAPPPAPLPIPSDLSGVQYPVVSASELVNAALASTEGILPGGLASISPAPTSFVVTPQIAETADTSGETTEVTTTSASIVTQYTNAQAKGDTQQSTSSGTPFVESEEILELDSAVLESQLAYPCSWGKSNGNECRALFSSQKELYDHVVDEHAT